MRIATANIGRGETPRAARANMQRVADAFGSRMVVGWQEIDEADAPREHHLLASLLPSTASKAGWSTLNPITIPAPWEVVHQYTVTGCAGLAHFTPAREFVVARCRNTARPTLPLLTFVNAHAPIDRLVTRTRRRAMVGVHRQIVLREVSHGYSVIWTEDTNDRKYPSTHAREFTLAHDGPDWIRCVEALDGVQIEHVASGSLDLTIDGHNAPWVQLDLTAP